MKLNVSERDRNILMILLVVAIIFCSYYFGYKNINNMTVEVKAEKDVLTAKYKSLYPLYSSKKDYVAKTKSFTEEYDSLMNQFPTGTTQEGMIVLAKAIEEDTGVWFSTFSMSEVTPIYTFGQISSSNPGNIGASVYSSDYVGNQVTLTLNYATTYEKGKELIKYLNSSTDRKYTIDSINMTYNDAVDQLAGTLVLSTYDVTGSGRESQDVAVHNVPIGTNNIFSSGSFSADNSYNEAEGDSIINDYDIYVMANAYASDSESVVVGTAKDALGKTVASSNSNSVESVTITVTGVNGNYKVSYKVGATTYPVDNYFDGADLNVGDTLDLLIMSSSRLSTEDKAGAKINIVNSSDKQLNIKVLNDDASNPRISFGTTTGSIQLFR